jgi:hypothetical protein
VLISRSQPRARQQRGGEVAEGFDCLYEEGATHPQMLSRWVCTCVTSSAPCGSAPCRSSSGTRGACRERGLLAAWTLPAGDSTGTATCRRFPADAGRRALALFAYLDKHSRLPPGRLLRPEATPCVHHRFERERDSSPCSGCGSSWRVQGRINPFPCHPTARSTSPERSPPTCSCHPLASSSPAYELVADGSLSQHVVASLERVLVGFLLAALAGIPLGVLLGWSRFVSDLLGPIVEGLRPIPPTRAEARRRTRWLPDDILSAEQPNAQEAPPS